MVESIACGLPVVTTDKEACRIVVEDNTNGLLVPAGDPKALADALERLISEEHLRKRLGRKGREIAVRDFDENQGTEEWHRFYNQLVP